MHLTALVKEVLDSKEIGDEYERIKRIARGDQSDPKLDHLCWICGNRRSNSHIQFLDYIQGNQSTGGKQHNKMRDRWDKAGKPWCIQWLQTCEELQASSETVESDNQAFSGADNGFSSENGYAGSHQDWQQQDWYVFAYQ